MRAVAEDARCQNEDSEMHALGCIFLELLGIDIETVTTEDCQLPAFGPLEAFKALALELRFANAGEQRSAADVHEMLQQMLASGPQS